MLLAIDFDEDFVDIVCVAETTVFALQAPGINGSEFCTPNADRLSADYDASLGQKIFDVLWLRLKR